MIGAHRIQKGARSESELGYDSYGRMLEHGIRVGPVWVEAYLERNQSFRVASEARLESLWSLII